MSTVRSQGVNVSMPLTGSGRAAGPRHGSDYGELSSRVKAAGLLDRRTGYYGVKIVLTLLVLAGGWVAFVVIGSSWWQVLVAAFLAVMFTQVAFLGHDAGHRQVFGSRRASYVLGILVGNLGIGLSYGWWVDKHNRHHANPNHQDKDPDVGVGALVYTAHQAKERRGIGRFLTRRQAFLFVPMLLLEGLNLHVASIRALFGRTIRGRSYRVLEAVLLATHVGGYLAAVFWVLTPGKAIVFIAVHQGLFGLYMGSCFAPNHKGMPVFGADDEVDFLRRQVLTSRNVRGGLVIDFVLGGLNHQIEHHLFPSMPRPNLRRSRQLIRGFCAEKGVSYAETGLLDSYRQVFAHLNVVGAPLRGPLSE